MPRIPVCFAALFFTFAAPLAAQRPDTTAAPIGRAPADSVVVLPTIEVIGSILPSAGPRIGSGVPARVSVISNAELEAREPHLISDALVSQPGISTYDDLGSPFKTTLVMRGFTASPVVGLPQGVTVFLDGVPLNEADAGQVNFDLIPLEHIVRVEVLNGTASLLGPNSLGGAVNLVTRHGKGDAEGEVELAVGSYDARSAEASVGGQTGAWSYYVGGGYDTEDGWRQLTSATLSNAFTNVGWLGERRGLNLQAFIARSDAQTAGSLPLSIFAVRPDSNFSGGDFEDLTQLHLALAGYTDAGPGRGSFSLYFRDHAAERFNVNQIADPDVRSFSENRTLGASADWRWAPTVRAGTLALRFGASGSVNEVGIRIFAERIDPGLTTDVRSPSSELGVFSLADYVVGRFAFSGGLRFDAIRIPFRNRLNPARDTTSTFVRLSPRAGVRAEIGGGAALYGSVGQSFRAPAVIELACADPAEPCPLPFALGDDPPLDPVVATTYEAGAEWTRGAASLAASLYRTEVRNDIFLFPFTEEGEPEGSTIDGFFANIDRTRREGAEMESRFWLRNKHLLYLNYAFTRATYQVEDVELFSIREEAGGENDVEAGDRFPLVPDHTVRGGALFALPGGFRAGTQVRYTGERWLRGDEANVEPPLDPYVVADAQLGYEHKGWGINVVAENLFNNDYVAFGTFNLNQAAGGRLERFLTPGPPRMLRLVVKREIGG